MPFIPGQLPYALQSDEESPLEVEKLVEPREQQMEGVLVYCI